MHHSFLSGIKTQGGDVKVTYIYRHPYRDPMLYKSAKRPSLCLRNRYSLFSIIKALNNWIRYWSGTLNFICSVCWDVSTLYLSSLFLPSLYSSSIWEYWWWSKTLQSNSCKNSTHLNLPYNLFALWQFLSGIHLL